MKNACTTWRSAIKQDNVRFKTQRADVLQWLTQLRTLWIKFLEITAPKRSVSLQRSNLPISREWHSSVWAAGVEKVKWCQPATNRERPGLCLVTICWCWKWGLVGGSVLEPLLRQQQRRPGISVIRTFLSWSPWFVRSAERIVTDLYSRRPRCFEGPLLHRLSDIHFRFRTPAEQPGIMIRTMFMITPSPESSVFNPVFPASHKKWCFVWPFTCLQPKEPKGWRLVRLNTQCRLINREAVVFRLL